MHAMFYFQNLLECQFDYNVKFKEKINMISSDELRCLPIGRDFLGKAYWFQTVILLAMLFSNYFNFVLYHTKFSILYDYYICVMSCYIFKMDL